MRVFNSLYKNSKNFWAHSRKIIGKHQRKNAIPMEVVSNGQKVTHVSTVLQKWQSDFAGLLAPGLIYQDEEAYQMQHNSKRVSLTTISYHWDSIVSKEEVSQTIWSQKI